jgi:predicted MPP superfamily phosphohydrolase
MTTLPIPIRQLAWATDLHLVFLRSAAQREFCESLAQMDADAIAITGDISDGRLLGRHLAMIAESVQKPIFVVLGNHDRYHTTFDEAEEQVARVAAIYPHIHRLTGKEIFELSGHTALVGIDGWADGISGSGQESEVILNDSVMIADFATLTREEGWKLMEELSQASAQTIQPALESAMQSFAEVILLTHVPPLPEAAWHEGGMSEPDFLPHFCNARLGETLRAACARHPKSKLTVLCGHTHGAGVHSEGNLTILTAGASYGNPRIDRVLAIPG